MAFPGEMEISVVAAVIQRDGCYLVCRRPAHKRHGGLWEFPGGKLEPGETFADAARRELAEELGLRLVEAGGLLYSSLDTASGLTINFVGVEAAGEPRLTEHSELAWLPAAELAALPLAPSDRMFVAHLTAGTRESGAPADSQQRP